MVNQRKFRGLDANRSPGRERSPVWLTMLLLVAVGCTKPPRKDLVDPYRHDFDCKIKWCQPEPKR